MSNDVLASTLSPSVTLMVPPEPTSFWTRSPQAKDLVSALVPPRDEQAVSFTETDPVNPSGTVRSKLLDPVTAVVVQPASSTYGVPPWVSAASSRVTVTELEVPVHFGDGWETLTL